MKKSPLRHLKNKWVIIGIVAAAIIAFFILRRGSAAPVYQSVSAEMSSVIETVSVTGTVSPAAKAGLAFEKSGVIAGIYVKVGDHVKKGDTIAALDDGSDRAALASAQATLADMARTLTPEELAVQETAVVSAQTSVANAKTDAANAAHNAFVKTEGAIFNNTDALFNNPQTSNPAINIHTQSQLEQQSINNERLAIGATFGSWSNDLASATADTAEVLLSRSSAYLVAIKNFVSDLSTIVNNLNTGNSGMTQAQIAADTGIMNNSLSILNTAIDSITAAKSELSSAQTSLDQVNSNYNLKLSGNSKQSVEAQAAKVAQARAVLAEDRIISPIDGIITKADPSVGEFAAAGVSGFAVQDQNFKVEAFVPEADIAKVSLGNMASSTLDAYAADIDFPAKVTMIDPAETVLEGVPTYKVTLQFVAADPRIRSGMTANLEILTHEHDGVLVIPYRAVTDDNGAKSVRVLSPDGKTFTSVPVTTGLKGSNGTIEILAGLKPGDRVVTYVK